ncbi:hypothetical protein [Streptomyces mirabilis]|uniref:hypothetical protein n=1 Tax=Streptomyces mirabilis TaxID=68239 RepID=UPI0036DAD643
MSGEEVRLTAMVSDGATHRRIAARLAWSEKTVEQRLTQLFRHTGCRSRVEPAAAWPDGGLAGRDLVADGVPGGSSRTGSGPTAPPTTAS